MFPPPLIKVEMSCGLSSQGRVSSFVSVVPIHDYSNGEWLYLRDYGHPDNPEGVRVESWAPQADAALQEELRAWLAEPLADFEAFAARILPGLCATESELEEMGLGLELTAKFNRSPKSILGQRQDLRPLYLIGGCEMSVWLPEIEEALRWAQSDDEPMEIHLDLRSLEDLYPALMYPLGELASVRQSTIAALFDDWITPGCLV
jgi:hypothetical protein